MAPDPLSIAVVPLQTVVSFPAFTNGNGFIVTMTELDFLHPFTSVPITVYVLVDVV
jgi:hypothetical protein